MIRIVLRSSVKFLLCWIFFCNVCNCILAQSTIYKVEHIPLNWNLANFSGTCMLQDSEGFIWFGSMDGLYRYDGKGFIKFQSFPDDPNSLTNNQVTCIIEARDGILWIGAEKGLTSYDKTTMRFTKYWNSSESGGFNQNNVHFLLEDQAGTIWVATRAGLCRFDKKHGVFTNFIPDNPHSQESDPWIWYLLEDSFGVLWVQDGLDGLSIFDRSTETFEYIKNTPADLNALYEDSFGRFWVTSWEGLYQLDRRTHAFTRYLHQTEDPNHLSNQMVRCMIEDGDHNFWIRTYDGIYKYSQNLEQLHGWKYDRSYVRSSAYYSFNKYLLLDNAGSLWYFSKSAISMITSREKDFTVYDPEPSNNSFVSGLHIGDQNILWFIYGDNEIVKLDRNTDTYTHYRIEPSDSIRFNQDLISSYLYVDKTGRFWIYHPNGELNRISFSDANTYQIVSSIIFPDKQENPKEIIEDYAGRLWIGSINKNLFYYDPEKGKIGQLANNPDCKIKLPTYGNTRIFIDSETFILAGGNGVYRIILPLIEVNDSTVMPTDVEEILPSSGDDLNIAPSQILRTVRKGEELIWICNWDRGLLQIKVSTLNKELINWEYYTTKQGLVDNEVTSILEDKQGNLWLGTKYGLSKFNPSTEIFTNFTQKNGLPISHMRYGTARKSSSGEFFFGTSQGMISFYPDRLQSNPAIPPVVISGFRVHNEPVEIELKELELTHKQNFISFEYAALNFIQAERNQYRYRLEGLNKDWINAGNRNLAEYTNLKPGKYIFRVIGSNNEGVWNEEGASLHFLIHPPPWQRWWAYVIYSIILILTMLSYRRFLLIRSRLRTELEIERIQKEKGIELNQMKTKFFTNISHEFRTPLTLLLGPIEDILKRDGNRIEADRGVIELMRRNAKRLQRLINQLLDISRLDSGKMKIKISEGDLEKFVRPIISSFQSLAESNKIDYQVRLPNENIRCFFDRDKLEKILTNLLSNAFKYTSKEGSVILELEYLRLNEDQAPQSTLFKVSDTGRGIAREQLPYIFDRFSLIDASDHREDDSMGIGLALTKELVELLEGSIKVKSEIDKGTDFFVTIPVSANSYSEEDITETEVQVMNDLLPEDETDPAEQNGDIQDNLNGLDNIDETHILVVEDNEDLRKYICSKLELEYVVLEAVNGEEGMRISMEKIPDLIISDLMMPVMDGIELCRKLKNDPRTSHIPVIILTAKADKRSKLDGLETGADDYMIKPFDGDELQVRVKNLITQRKNLREVYRKQLIERAHSQEHKRYADPLIQKLLASFEENYYDFDFKVNDMGKELHMSRAQFYRKVNALTGATPNELLRQFRIKKAASLIESDDLNITAIMYEVGFRSSSHFAESFRKYYGKNPSDYRDSLPGSK